MTVKFIGRDSYCTLVYDTCSSYYISVFALVNGIQMMEFCSDGGKLRFTVKNRDEADKIAEDLKRAVDNKEDAEFNVEAICL